MHPTSDLELIASAFTLPNLAFEWIGIFCLVVFVIGYYFIAAEEKYHINKTKPALFIGTLMFITIGFYLLINGLPTHLLKEEVNAQILEISQIIFFLMVAMTFIEALTERDAFNALKYKLTSRGFSYKKLFWLTGLLAFFISPVADNLTTALILSTVLLTIDKSKPDFLVPGAINIVVAANAGGAWSPFGDITTLMVWTAEKGAFLDFFSLFPSAFIGWALTAYLLALYVPKGAPEFDAKSEKPVAMKAGGLWVIILGAFTITCAVSLHSLYELPAMWGMLYGLSIFGIYSYFFNQYHQRRGKPDRIDIFAYMMRIEMDTLMFFFGILAAVGALHFTGWLGYAARLYDITGATAANIGVGFISAIVDNVPVMSAVLKTSPNMGLDQWLLVTLTAGIGGSLISFGSAAGVGVMGKMRGIYTFMAHLRYAWTILAGYFVSLLVWYFQFELLRWY